MNESNKAKSIKARLLNLSKGENKKYQQLIVRFFHERLLYRLTKSVYRDKFILKGGALLYAFEKFEPRPTVDLDFMGRFIDNDKDNILNVFKEIAALSYSEDGVTFLTQTMKANDITIENKYPGVRLSMTASLGTFLQSLTIDIGFGDIICPDAMKMDYPTLFDNLEEPENLLVYSLESVVAEKFQTMIDRGKFNSRMKDFFDLYRIILAHKFEKELLAEALKVTFENRSTAFNAKNEFFSEDFGKDKMLNQLWDNYIRKMNLNLPDFRQVHNIISEFMKPYWMILSGL